VAAANARQSAVSKPIFARMITGGIISPPALSASAARGSFDDSCTFASVYTDTVDTSFCMISDLANDITLDRGSVTAASLVSTIEAFSHVQSVYSSAWKRH
jgi:hypothetical protein